MSWHKLPFCRPFQTPESSRSGATASLFDRNKLSQYTDVVQCFNTQGEYDAELKRRSRVWNLLECVSWQIQQSLSSLAANVKATSEELDVIFHPGFEQHKSKNSYFSQFMNLTKIRLLISPSDTEKIILAFMIFIFISALCCFLSWRSNGTAPHCATFYEKLLISAESRD